MNLVLIGKHLYSETWEQNQLDNPLFERLGRVSDNLLIIAQGRGSRTCVVRHQNIELVLVPVRPLGDHFYFICSALRQFWVRRSQADWQVLSASEPIGGGLSSVLLNWRFGIPFLAMVQGDLLDLPSSHFSRPKRWFLKRITLYVARRATAVRGVSQKILNTLLAEGIVKDKVFLLRNRVDLARFNSDSLRSIREDRRIKFGWENNRVLLYAGAFTAEKGTKEFVGACSKLLPLYEDLRILFIGDGLLRSWCDKQLSRYSDRVNFTGFIPHQGIQDWLSVGDIYAFTSHHEGMPRVVLEYMAMGKPVVSTSVGGISEVIADGENGLLIEPANTDELVEKVRLVLDRVVDGARLGEKARKTVEDFHDVERTIADQVVLYRKLVKGGITSSP